MLFADECSIVVVSVRGVTCLPLLSSSHKPFQELRVDAPLYIDPAGAQADFSLGDNREGRRRRIWTEALQDMGVHALTKYGP